MTPALHTIDALLRNAYGPALFTITARYATDPTPDTRESVSIWPYWHEPWSNTP